jgi:hypothetical protein
MAELIAPAVPMRRQRTAGAWEAYLRTGSAFPLNSDRFSSEIKVIRIGYRRSGGGRDLGGSRSRRHGDIDADCYRLERQLQSFDPIVRRTQRLHGLNKLHQVLRWTHGRIPVINADLITGLPGQTLKTTLADLQQLMAETRINAITTYDFSPANAPSVVAGLQPSGPLPVPS